MGYIFFFIYLAVFCWLLTKIKFVKEAGFTATIIILLFLVRIAVGCINGYLNLYHFPVSDVLNYHNQGLDEYRLLLSSPKEYFMNIFKYDNSYTAFLDTTDSFWNNLRSDLIIKMLSVFNIFSRGNFFINVIFFNFLVFFASVSFYKVFITIFPDKKRLLIICLFLLPSLIYFSAGIHRDGLIFLGLSIFIYNLFFLLKEKKQFLKKILWMTLGVIIIFLLRNFVLIALIPAAIAWIIAEKYKGNALRLFLGTYVAFIVLFFTLGYVHPALDLPQYVSDRQLEYIEISKNSSSAININPLFPHFRSFLNNAPQALNHSLMRPYLSENNTWFHIPPAIEIFLYEITFLLFLFFKNRRNIITPLIYFSVFFSLSMFLMIGYTIPIIGALVRYRSIYFPFLIIPLLCTIDWQKLKKLLHIRI